MGRSRLFFLILILSVYLISPTHTVAQKSIFDPPEKNNCPRSQKQAHIWYFGEKAGIDFNSGTATVLTNQDVMTAYKASGVMSDSVGNLLFFTNGRKVWDRSFNLMPGATELYGDVGVTQPCIVVHRPGADSIYFLFTVDVLAFMPDNTYSTRGINYTVIDMKERGGYGDAVNYINVPLLTPACQKITAVHHANGRDFWVIAHKWDSDEFYAWLLSVEGLSDPVISSAGAVHGGGYGQQVNAIGYMKASPDGSMIAVAITGSDEIELFDFDNSTGEISFSDGFTTTQTGISPYGLEFSPNSRMLYSTLLQIIGNGPPTNPSYVLQFDLDNGLNNPVAVDSVQGMRLAGIQLGPDGRIYISRTINLLSKNDSLDVIYNPTRSGTECNYNRLDNISRSRFDLEGRNGIYSLPNIVQSYVDIPVFTYDSCCFLDVTQFHISNTANIDQASWDFGDGNTSTDMEPIHAYAQAGTYTVSLTETFNGITFTDTGSVVIHELPVIELGDTIMLYTGSTINLWATENMQSYLWSTGYTGQVLPVENQGEYWVEVKDWQCCTNFDSVYIKVFEYYIPTAFSPNGDGLNDIFRVVGLYRNINFIMYIYNRWGQLVFQSDDIDQGWDGTVKNQLAESDTYVWILQVGFLGEDIITNGDVVLKGTVTLVK
ncbi:MAG: gliding motility-associated C-terminal domain-containing protein [Bacteroidales bacterium]|nr:gliding motility-associated C-terminal domain-containing protein [Bacteroidales bacterium]